jgi:hypothetical protein
MAEAETPEETPAETPEEKRARVMRRLAEIIRADPPDLSGSGSGPVTTGGFPMLPADADEFDQESAAELFAALGQFFEQQRRKKAGPEEPERE